MVNGSNVSSISGATFPPDPTTAGPGAGEVIYIMVNGSNISAISGATYAPVDSSSTGDDGTGTTAGPGAGGPAARRSTAPGRR